MSDQLNSPQPMELLAPAGSPEALQAAVQAGAGAVYLGFGTHNARRGAKNFSPQQFSEAVQYCHIRGVRVYLTLNTLVRDGELGDVCDQARFASQVGADAVLVQDLGVLSALRGSVPDLPIHASTQMSIMNLDGAKAAADLGCTRVVLARELPKDQIAYICAHSPIETEVFVHGAQCLCYSGQCFFSSVIGARSGNRGMCAQPCRLPYGWGAGAGGPLLSLKDLCLAQHLQTLREMGVACLKIEGRMKRPEYVWVVTQIYASALREGREPTSEELGTLMQAFSRQGFTDGYFQDRTGPGMFGARPEGERDPRDLFASARAAYAKEHILVPLTGLFTMRAGVPMELTLEDGVHTVSVQGTVPEAARSRATTSSEAEAQLRKTGGTPYHITRLDVDAGCGLAVPAAGLNALRREALEALDKARSAPPERRQETWSPRRDNEGRQEGAPVWTLSLRQASQLTDEVLAFRPAVLYLPLETALEVQDRLGEMGELGIEPSVILPRALWDRETGQVEKDLALLKKAGAVSALVTNLGGIALARRTGLVPRGDYGLEVTNSACAGVLKDLGLTSLTLSFEQRLSQIRDLDKPLPCEILAYGRLPMMITQQCLYKARDGRCRKGCQEAGSLVDRRRVRFPVLPAYGCRSEIFNSVPVWLMDRQTELGRLGLWALRLNFTTESPRDCADILDACRTGAPAPGPYTRGLYFRDVE